MIRSYINVITASIKAVPAVKYALGVAGLIMTVALVKSFGIDYIVSIIGCVILLVLMVVLFLFSKIAKFKDKHIYIPALLILYSFTLLTISTAILFFTSVFFDKPLKLNLFNPKVIVNPTDSTNINNIQVLRGRVIDERTGKDIDSVHIKINKSNKIYLTDTYGNFIIPINDTILNDPLEIVFFKRGFDTKRIITPFQEIPLRVLLNKEK